HGVADAASCLDPGAGPPLANRQAVPTGRRQPARFPCLRGEGLVGRKGTPDPCGRGRRRAPGRDAIVERIRTEDAGPLSGQNRDPAAPAAIAPALTNRDAWDGLLFTFSFLACTPFPRRLTAVFAPFLGRFSRFSPQI